MADTDFNSGISRVGLKFWDAISARDIPLLRQLFAEHPEQIDAHSGIAGGTLLHYACSRGSLDAVRLMVELGCDVNRSSTLDGHLPIDNAASVANVEIVEFLIAAGSSLDVSSGASNPLYGAIIAGRGHTEHWNMIRAPHVAELLLRAGLDYKQQHPKKGRTENALKKAWDWGAREIHELIGCWDKDVSAGREPELPFTCAMYRALTDQDLRRVEALFAAQPDHLQKGDGLFDNEQTAFGSWLHAAAINASPEIAAFFIDRGFKVDAESQDVTPLWMAARNDNVPMIAYLLDRGADPRSSAKFNPLLVAIGRDSTAAVELLLAAGASTTKGFYKTDAIGFARQGHHHAVLPLLENWPAKH
ncbi:MAG: ankyrin repeat domain-containing protein [Terricaulis sp.]